MKRPYNLEHISPKKYPEENLFRSGSGSRTGYGRNQNSDTDLVKNRPDPQQWNRSSNRKRFTLSELYY
jgi:hypothetical protein